MAILVGASAPPFALDGWYNLSQATFDLSAQRGRAVALAFYPGDERLVCTRQMCSYSDNLADVHRFDAAVWGIAPQDIESHRRFAEGRRLKMPLLSDPEQRVAKSFGIVGAFGLRRSVFVIDPKGIISWRWVSTTNLTFPSAADIKQALTDATGHAVAS
jgi:thioredoxin-dependent peroxiredoxin